MSSNRSFSDDRSRFALFYSRWQMMTKAAWAGPMRRLCRWPRRDPYVADFASLLLALAAGYGDAQRFLFSSRQVARLGAATGRHKTRCTGPIYRRELDRTAARIQR